jgi:hypothetical protein
MNEDRVERIVGEYVAGLAISIAAGLRAAAPDRVRDVLDALVSAQLSQPPNSVRAIASVVEALRHAAPS